MIKATDYLKKERRLDDKTIQQFMLGYCDPQGTIYVNSDFPQTHLELKPHFRDAVLFPIFNLYGDLVGISARPFKKDSLKYVNTVYAKTEHLYALSVTWKDCLQARKVYIVEGNIDVATMWQKGIKNVVGMLGVILSEKQLCLLSRFVDEIVLVPDSDTGGEKFLQRMKRDLKNTAFDLKIKIIDLPKGLDLDTFLKDHTIEEFMALEKKHLFPTLKELLQEL